MGKEKSASRDVRPKETKSKNKRLYKPSRVTVEYYSNNNEPSSPIRNSRSPESRSDDAHQARNNSSHRSAHMTPISPRSPLSASSEMATMSSRSPVSTRPRMISMEGRKKEPLLSDDEVKISKKKSKTKTKETKEIYLPPVLAAVQSNDSTIIKDRYEMMDPAPGISVKEIETILSSMDHSDVTSDFTRQETASGLFTAGSGSFGADTYAADTYGNYTNDSFSVDTPDTKRNFMRYRYGKSMSYNDSSSLGSSSLVVKQQVAWGCIFLSAGQFGVLITQVLMCGIASLVINPMIGPYPDAFSEWGGKNTYLLVEDEQYFRLITPTFLHVGFLHLLINVFFQLETCAYLEREWGFCTWIIIYLISGFGSCLAASAIDPNVIGVCSSGALMGLFGAKIAQTIMWTALDVREEYVDQAAGIFDRLGGTVCSASVIFFLTFLTYIDWAGHLGGFVTGFLVGMQFFAYAIRNRPTRAILRFIGILGMVIGGVVLGVLLFHYTEADEDLADACDYFRNLYPEGYACECQAFD